MVSQHVQFHEILFEDVNGVWNFLVNIFLNDKLIIKEWQTQAITK